MTMRNRWGVELRRGFYVWGTGPRGGNVEGRIASVDSRSAFAKAYGPRILLENGQSMGVDDVRQVLPPMTIADDGTVSANPVEVHVDIDSHNTKGRNVRAKNPTPRLERADQPSQRARMTKTGAKTKRASERLKQRRALTHYAKTPGVWANPLSRVKVKSPSMRDGEAPSDRLVKRRKKTTRAPEGFYANPAAKTPDFLVQFLPVNQAWAMTWGPQIIGVSVGAREQRLWESRAELVAALKRNGLNVDRRDKITGEMAFAVK